MTKLQKKISSLGISAADLAKALKLPVDEVQGWFDGKRPHKRGFFKLAEYLKVDPEVFSQEVDYNIRTRNEAIDFDEEINAVATTVREKEILKELLATSDFKDIFSVYKTVAEDRDAVLTLKSKDSTSMNVAGKLFEDYAKNQLSEKISDIKSASENLLTHLFE